MHNDIRAPLKRTAVDGRSKGVVDNQRHMMRVGHLGKHLDVDHIQRGIGYRFNKHRLGVRLEHPVQLVRRDRGTDKIKVDAQVAQRLVEQVERTAVNRRGRNNMIARFGDIGNADQRRRLTRRGQHGADAAL